MQYISDCLDCDSYWATPQSNDAERHAREHVQESGHDVSVKGRYDSPTNGGIYVADEDADLGYRIVDDPREKRKIVESKAPRY